CRAGRRTLSVRSVPRPMFLASPDDRLARLVAGGCDEVQLVLEEGSSATLSPEVVMVAEAGAPEPDRHNYSQKRSYFSSFAIRPQQTARASQRHARDPLTELSGIVRTSFTALRFQRASGHAFSAGLPGPTTP